jgi:hypothetical protein
MSHAGHIIPFPTRGRETARAGDDHLPTRAAPHNRHWAWALVGAVAFVGVVGGTGVLIEGQSQRDVARIAAPNRVGVFRRASEDLRETCNLPEAAVGPLHDHCASQASFVMLFPECDAACAQVARAFLPRARR